MFVFHCTHIVRSSNLRSSSGRLFIEKKYKLSEFVVYIIQMQKNVMTLLISLNL